MVLFECLYFCWKGGVVVGYTDIVSLTSASYNAYSHGQPAGKFRTSLNGHYCMPTFAFSLILLIHLVT